MLETYVFASYRPVRKSKIVSYFKPGEDLVLTFKLGKCVMIPTQIVKMYPHSMYHLGTFSQSRNLSLEFRQHVPENLDSFHLKITSTPNTSKKTWDHNMQMSPHPPIHSTTPNPLDFLPDVQCVPRTN